MKKLVFAVCVLFLVFSAVVFATVEIPVTVFMGRTQTLPGPDGAEYQVSCQEAPFFVCYAADDYNKPYWGQRITDKCKAAYSAMSTCQQIQRARTGGYSCRFVRCQDQNGTPDYASECFGH